MAWTNNESSTSTAGSAARISGGVSATVASDTTITVSDFITPISGTATIQTINGPVAGEMFGLSSLDGFVIGVAGNITGFAGTMTITAGSVAFFAKEGSSCRIMQSVASGDVLLRSGGSQPIAAALDVGSFPIYSGAIRVVPGALVAPRLTEDTIAIGTGALADPSYVPAANGSVAIGYNTLNAATTADNNVAVGHYALSSDITGGNSVAVGHHALKLTTGANNTAVGSLALATQTTPNGNTAVGTAAARYTTTGDDITAVGVNALLENTTGQNNTAIGARSMKETDAGDNNTAVGVEALYGGIGADQVVNGTFASATGWTFGAGWSWSVNKAVHSPGGAGTLTPSTVYIDYGVGSTYRITYTVSDYAAHNVRVKFGGATGTWRGADGTYVEDLLATAYPGILEFEVDDANADLAVDTVSLFCISNENPTGNTAIGVGAMYHVAVGAPGTGQNNVAVGLGSSRQQTTANDNVAVGVECMTCNGTGDGNTAVGRLALYSGNTCTKNVAIGYGAGFYETGNNKLFIDNAQRASEADGRIKALVYGVFDAAVANQSLTFNAASTIQQGAYGELWTHGWASEEMTIAAAATSDSTANLLPANSIIEAVVLRVTTVIPTAATFTVGDATQASRFATGVAVAAGTTAVGLLHTDPTVGAATLGPTQTAAAKIRITPDLSPAANTGRVRVTVFYRQFTAPTS